MTQFCTSQSQPYFAIFIYLCQEVQEVSGRQFMAVYHSEHPEGETGGLPSLCSYKKLIKCEREYKALILTKGFLHCFSFKLHGELRLTIVPSPP